MSTSLLRAAAALAVAAVVLSACGAQTSSGSGSGAGSGGTTGAVPPSDPSGPSSGPPPLQDPSIRVPEPANTVTPRPDAVRQVPARWSSATPVSGQAGVLVRGTLTGGPPCQVVGRVEASETGSTVVVTVHVGREPGADCSGPQPQLAFPYVVRVPLRAPVGDRVVRDGAA